MTRLCGVLLAVLTTTPGDMLLQSRELTVRFHHVHYRVQDPSAAMSEAAGALQGTRVILPGLGVGVRAGDEYVLFDREDSPAANASAQSAVAAYGLAAGWLAERGIVTARRTGESLKPLALFGDARPDHIAFATNDMTAVAAHLRSRGAAPLRAREDAVLFDTGAGVVVEIVRDPDRPDAYWCPMHPDVRSPDAGRCSLCGMSLVLIPPPIVGEYRLDLKLEPGPRGRGLRGMRFTVREPASDAQVRRFAAVHEKTFHLFVISRDLEYFQHVHPDVRPDGTIVLEQAIPPGEYMLFADFLPEGGTPQMVQRAIISPGRAGWRRIPGEARETRQSSAEGITVSLETAAARAGKELPMTFTMIDTASGAPVTDLQPYLGAPAHILMVRSDLGDAVHAHPEEVTTAGPTVSFHPLIPTAGVYKLWIQVQRAGKVITVPFVVRAAQ